MKLISSRLCLVSPMNFVLFSSLLLFLFLRMAFYLSLALVEDFEVKANMNQYELLLHNFCEKCENMQIVLLCYTIDSDCSSTLST